MHACTHLEPVVYARKLNEELLDQHLKCKATNHGFAHSLSSGLKSGYRHSLTMMICSKTEHLEMTEKDERNLDASI